MAKIILDVRTPREYADGHLEGSRLLDFNSGQFETALAGLDPEVGYLVYCRSGNRSGQAMYLMQEAGFTDVVNLGSLQAAADATGIPITR